MSGSITPFVKLYDGFFFTDKKEPCGARYRFEKALRDEYNIDRGYPLDTFEEYIDYLTEKRPFVKDLVYEKIEIVEKEKDE